tara:strand:- start:158 stop:406 length:249 start_codon:yes stop_codon:yes gene_type:complete
MNFIQLIFAYINKNLKSLRQTDNLKEKRKLLIQIIFLSTSVIFYVIIQLPPGVSASEIMYAGVIFLVILYFVFRTLKYFKIL